MARRTLPDRLTTMSAIRGEWIGNLRSTPSPWTIRRTTNISRVFAARPGDHHAVEDLDAFLLAFENPDVDIDRVADLELGQPTLSCWSVRPAHQAILHDSSFPASSVEFDARRCSQKIRS